jgi:hypothetical protein
MRLILFFSHFFSLLCFAQETTPFDFLEANRQLMKSNQALSRLNGSYSGNGSNDCVEKVGLTGETYMSCAVKEVDFDDTLILKINYTPSSFPSDLKKMLPPDFTQKIEKKNVSCVFNVDLGNDNQQMLGRKAEQHIKNSAEFGDDFFRTHKLGVGINCVSEDGINSSYVYSTELYSDPDRLSAQRLANGNVGMKQHFTSENIFALIQDNINQNGVSYWKQGLGFINLSQKKKWGLLQSTGQQEWFHERMNAIKRGSAYDYEYEEGSKDKWTPFVALGMGLQMNKKYGDRCKINASAEVGARIAGLKQSTLNLNLNAKASYRITDNGSIYISASDESTVRSGSIVRETTLAVGVESRRGSYLQLSATQQRGNRKDVPDKPNVYTNKNDLWISIKLGYNYY